MGPLVYAGVGAALWIAIAAAGATNEPWDAPIYWGVGYPAALALAGTLGFAWPDTAKAQALVLFAMQLPVMLANGAGFSLLPLGIIAIAVLALPAILVAVLAARLRRRSPR